METYVKLDVERSVVNDISDSGRRRFLKSGLLGVCAAATMSPFDLLASPMVNVRPSSVVGLIANAGRFNSFHAAAKKNGPVLIVGNDLWSTAEEISKLASSGYPSILAATCQASFTVLSQLALESGYRLAYVGDHKSLSTGIAEHSLRGDYQWIAAVGSALTDGSWEHSLYPVLSDCLLNSSSHSMQKSCVLTGPASSYAAEDHLWRTWAMVPTNTMHKTL
jgi:hypothetical protein